jgi:ABC-type antimicrobial peptide transport system permease subunit
MVRTEIRDLDPTLPVSDLKTMHAALGFALLPARMAAGVVTAFAFLALLLAAVGLYGVIAYSVSQGMRDIGIRMALGADSTDVLKLVVRQGVKLAFVGLLVGLVAGLGLTRFMAGLLYNVSATDPSAYGVAAIVLAGVALLASYLPAQRATAVDPVVALRDE